MCITGNKTIALFGNIIMFYSAIIRQALCRKRRDDYFRFVEKKMKIIMLGEFLFVHLQQCSYEIHASSHCIDITRITCDWQLFYTNSCPFFHYFVFLSQIQSLSQLTSTIDILLFLVTILYIHSKYPGLSDKFLRLASFLNKQESSYTYAFAIIKSKITNND